MAALTSTAVDTPLGDRWLARFPYASAAFRLMEPLEVSDGSRTGRYFGFVVVGVNVTVAGSVAVAVTTYVSVPDADGIGVLWVFEDPDGGFGVQTVTLMVRPDAGFGVVGSTIGSVVATVRDVTRLSGASPGEEIATLAPLTVSAIAYLSSRDPDVVRVAGAGVGVSRSARVREVAEVGWRVGAALRGDRAVVERGAAGGGGGWTLTPHIRAAHFHRVRVASRGVDGTVTGDRMGVEGVDWHYELRW
ncbi:MAG: hypothetical protein ACKO91_11975, partial [Acidimicrobiales bacterium]